MHITEILGKTITDITIKAGLQEGWLDTAECSVHLNHDLIIDIPYSNAEQLWVKEHDSSAQSIRSVMDAEVYNNILNRSITNFYSFTMKENIEKGFIELDNGFLITEVIMAPHGTETAGLWYFDSMEEVKKYFSSEFTQLKDSD